MGAASAPEVEATVVAGTPHRTACLAVVLLLSVAIAGCTGPSDRSDGDDAGADGTEPPAIPEEPPQAGDCQTGKRFSEDLIAYSAAHPVNTSRAWCWDNTNATNSTDPITYLKTWRRPSQGTAHGVWHMKIWDADDTVWFNRTFAPGPNYWCQPPGEGRPGRSGQWTIWAGYRNFTGNHQIRMEVEPDSWACYRG